MTAPDRVRYLEEVRDLYLALRGGGLCLSPLDVDLVGGWWALGVPLPLALDALRDAAARHRGSGRAAARRPFPLRLAAPLVDERFGAYVRRSGTVARRDPPGAGTAPETTPGETTPGETTPGENTPRENTPGENTPGESAAAPADAERPLDRLAATLARRAAAAAPAAAAAYRAAIAALQATRAARASLDRSLSAADHALAIGYLRALPRPDQRRLAREAAREAGPRGRVPPAVHRATLRVHLGVAARLHGGLDRPSDLS